MEILIYGGLLRSWMLWIYLFLINFEKGGCMKCNIFLISKGNKLNCTHIIVDNMGQQNVEN